MNETIYAWVISHKNGQKRKPEDQVVIKVNTGIQSYVENVMIALGFSGQYYLLKDFRANDNPDVTVVEVSPALSYVSVENAFIQDRRRNE